MKPPRPPHVHLATSEVSHSYIELVHNLIERCLLYQMDREECVEALAKHAHVQPVITATVWRELEKANREFFSAYNSTRRKYRRSSVNQK